MLDLGHLSNSSAFMSSCGKGDLQIFTTPSTVTNLQWSTWKKPRGCSMFYALMLGGGGGGGGGFSRTTNGDGGGGGGGGSSGQVVMAGPIFLLSDILYIQVGAGGAGTVSGGGTAGSGVRSYIAVYPDINANNAVLTCSPTVPTGGVTGTVLAGGGGGTAGTITAIANQCFNGLGFFQSIAGQNGTAGGAQSGANGTALTLPTTGAFTTGGTGGGGSTGTDFLGGAFSATAQTLVSEARPATAGTNGHGSGGTQLWKPFFCFGGGGGSTNNSATAGNGGNGAYGSGGGGGGAGNPAGRGGEGGNGIIIIYCW